MLNIDTRFLDQVDADQYWFVTHILKRANKNNACFPSNKTLCSDTGWNIKKLQKVKSELIDKGLLIVKTRDGDKNRQGSNWYIINTELIGVFVPGKDMDVLLQDTPKTDTLKSLRVPRKRAAPGTPKADNEVLTSNEVLNSLSEESDSQKPVFNANTSNSKESREEVQEKLFDEEENTRGTAPHNESRPKSIEIKSKKGKVTLPEYKPFVDTFAEKYPGILDFPKDGAKINSLILKVRKKCEENNVPPNVDNVVEMWKIFVDNLIHTWCHMKDLSTIESKFNATFEEMKAGGGMRQQGRKPTPSQVFGKYRNHQF